MQRKHIAGKGIAGNHSSVIPLAHTVVRYALTLTSVDRCAPGKITVKKTASRALQISYDEKFITLHVVDRGLIQRVLIFCTKESGNEIAHTITALESFAATHSLRCSILDKS
jgi:hypothetical protein